MIAGMKKAMKFLRMVWATADIEVDASSVQDKSGWA